ncbi:MAG TPA: O-antigen ligase family protein [Chloroflexota bacterium]|nr:O-antigen ligase family protein [Chloroflexota bacterium]
MAGRSRPVVVAVLVLGALVGGLPPLYGAALLVGGAVTLAVLANPVLGLALLGFAIPLSPAGDTLPLAPNDALALLIMAAVALAGLVRRRFTLTPTGAFWPGVAFVVVAILSALGAGDALVSIKEVVRWAEVLGILVATASLCQRWEERRLVLFGVLAGAIGEALIGWGQFFLRRGPPSFRIGPFLRAYGTFGQPNPFGGYFALTLPVILALLCWLWLRSRERRPAAARWPALDRWFFLAVLVAGALGGAALLMSLSRGALMGVIGGGLVLVALLSRRGGLLVVAVAGLALAVFGLESLHLLPPAVSNRLAQIVEYGGWFDTTNVVPTPQNWAIVERMAHWQAAWNMYIANPLLGVGPGHYALAYPTYRVNDFWLDPLGHAHNIYLNVMAELGFLGIATYLGQLVAWILVCFAAFRRARTTRDRFLACGVLASLLAVAIHNVFDNLSVHGLATLLGMLVGLAGAIDRGDRAENQA